MENRYRSLIPNSLTMASLACGTLSLLFSVRGDVQAAGIFIMVSCILDLVDGIAARALKAGSAFGLQLDSLADLISLGAAPGVLIFVHLQQSGVAGVWVWAAALLVPLTGAFRLARYNTLPTTPTAAHHTLGLTISTGGAVLTLAVLTDLTSPSIHLPPWSLLLLVYIVCLLMASRIVFPSFAGLFSELRRGLALVVFIGASLLVVPFLTAWFLWTSGYIVFSLLHAGFGRLQHS